MPKEHEVRLRGCTQVWTFRGIRPGDRVVANQGKQAVLGYRNGRSRATSIDPGERHVDGGDHPHQVKVAWDDTTPRAVEQVRLAADDCSSCPKRISSAADEARRAEPPSDAGACRALRASRGT